MKILFRMGIAISYFHQEFYAADFGCYSQSRRNVIVVLGIQETISVKCLLILKLKI